VNHDLKNGFTPIRNVVRHLSEVARESPPRFLDVYRERERTLESALEYLEELAANWARLSMSTKRAPCDLGGIVREVVRGRDDTRARSFQMALAPTLPHVLADPLGLRRVIENLVANACESSSSRGTVEISAEECAENGKPSVRLKIRDQGQGIPAGDLPRIFDPFFTTKEKGSGIGLSIVKRLVSDYEGTIEVASEKGRGTEVVVTLPAAETSREVRS
jgi:signal transduction histidine kinase